MTYQVDTTRKEDYTQRHPDFEKTQILSKLVYELLLYNILIVTTSPAAAPNIIAMVDGASRVTKSRTAILQ